MNKMNKTSINLLCICILVMLAISILLPAVGMTASFSRGLSDGIEDVSDTSNYAPSTFIEIIPKMEIPLPQEFSDSVRFDDGRTFAAQPTTLHVEVPASYYPTWINIFVGLCYLGCIVIYIFFAIKFVKFVVNINRGIIFDLKNIRLLNAIGILLIIISILQISAGVAEDYVVESIGLTLGGVEFTTSWTIPWSELIIGLIALLMAQVWYRGYRLKKDQELTI